MSTEVGGAVYVIDADLSGVEAGLDGVKTEFRELQIEADRVAQRGAAAMRNLGASMKALVDAGGNPGKAAASWAKATGLDAGEMDKVAAQAKAVGLSFEELTLRLMNFRNEGFRAKRGVGDLYAVLKEYDMEAAVAMRLSQNQADRQVVLNTALARATSQTAKAKIETAAFGTALKESSGAATLATTSFGAMSKALVGFLSVTAVISGLSKIKAAIDDVDQIGDVADRIGVTTTALQGYRYAAIQAGASTEDMDRALQSFAEKVSDAERKTGPLYQLFKDNNVELKDAKGNLRSVNDLFLEWSNLVANAKTPTDALSMATDTLGKEVGRELVNALKGGAQGFKDMEAQAVESGHVISEETIAANAETKKSYDALLDYLTVRWQTFAVAVASIIRETYRVVDDTDLVAKETERDRLLGELRRGGISDAHEGVYRKRILELQDEIDQIKLLSVEAGKIAVPPQLTVLRDGRSDLPGKHSGTRYRPQADIDAEEAAAKAAADHAKSVDNLIRSLEFQEAQTKRTAEEQFVMNQLQQAGETLSTKAGQAIAAQARQTYRAQQAFEAYGKSRKALDDFTSSIDEQTAALEQEIATYGLSNAEKQRYLLMAKAEALSNGEVTDALRQKIDAQADLMRQTDDLADTTRRLEDITDAERDAFKSFFTDLAHGKSVVASLQDALGGLLDKLIDIALNDAFDALFGGGSGGGFLGGLLGNLFGGGSSGGGLYERSLLSTESLRAAMRGPEMAYFTQGRERLSPARDGGQSHAIKITQIVENNNGSNVVTQASQTQNGEVILRAIVQDEMGRQMPRMLSAGFGISPATRRR